MASSVNFHLLQREPWITPGEGNDTKWLEISFTLIYHSYIQHLEDLVEGFLLTVEKCMCDWKRNKTPQQQHDIIILLYFALIKLATIKSPLDLAASHDLTMQYSLMQFRNIAPFVSVHICTAISGICGYTSQASRQFPWRCFGGKSQEWTSQKM